MDENNKIGQLVDAKMAFRLKKLNDQRAEQGLSPLTIKELIMRDRFEEASSNEIDDLLSSIIEDTDADPLDKIRAEAKKEASNITKANFKPKPVDPNITPSEIVNESKLNQKRREKELLEFRENHPELEPLPPPQPKAKILSPKFGGDAAKLSERNKEIQEFTKETPYDIANERRLAMEKGLEPDMPNILGAKDTEIANEILLTDLDSMQAKNDFEAQLYAEKIDELTQRYPSDTLEKASIDPNFNVVDLEEAQTKKFIKELNELLDSSSHETLEKTHQSLNPKNLYREAESQIAEESLKNLKQSNPSGRVSVDYGDFRTPKEKMVDDIIGYVKNTPVGKMGIDAAKTAGKVLQYAAPPLAAYDLFWNKPHESAKEIQRKGLAQELSELGLDISALAAPAARLAGKAALGAGLDMAAMPIAAALIGKEFFPGNEPRDPNAPEIPKQYSPIFAPSTGLANVPGADEMPHFKDIKSLLKK